MTLVQSYSVHFGHIQSIQFNSIHFGLIWSNSVHSVIFIPFGPIRSSLVHSVHSDSICFISFLAGPFCSLWSSLVHIGLIRSFWSYLTTLILFGPTQSILVYFDRTQSIQSTLVLFDPFWSILIHFIDTLRREVCAKKDLLD